MMNTESSVIILNYNDYETTIKLAALVQTYDSIGSVIIVDNNSTDNSYEALKKWENHKIKVVKTPRNGGYAYGNNFGMKYAKENYNPEYFIICNPDVEFEERVVKRIVGYLRNHKDTAAASAVVLDQENKPTGESAWTLPTYIQCLSASSLIIKKLVPQGYYSLEHFSEGGSAVEVEAIMGSFLVVRAEAMEAVGYYDEDTFLYCEESILGYKLKEKGFKTVILKDISYRHLHSQSINRSIKSLLGKYKILQQSRSVYLNKYLKVNKAQRLLFKVITELGKIEWFLYGMLK